VLGFNEAMNLPVFATIAGFYSQLAGVLAGFAFAGLIALAATQFTSGTRASASLESFLPLVSSFLGLVTASLNYAIIAGEGGDGRSAMLEIIGGLGFSIAGVMLFYALLVLVHGAKSDSAAPNPTVDGVVGFTRATLIFGISPTVILLVQGGVSDEEAVRFGPPTGLHWLDYIAFGAAALAFGFAAFSTRRTSVHAASSTSPTPPSPRVISIVAAALSLLCVAATTLIGNYVSANVLTPLWLQLSIILTLFGFVIFVIRSAVKYR
jgi:hypothetical protein